MCIWWRGLFPSPACLLRDCFEGEFLLFEAEWQFLFPFGMRPSSIQCTCPSHRKMYMDEIPALWRSSLMVTLSCQDTPRTCRRHRRWKTFSLRCTWCPGLATIQMCADDTSFVHSNFGISCKLPVYTILLTLERLPCQYVCLAPPQEKGCLWLWNLGRWTRWISSWWSLTLIAGFDSTFDLKFWRCFAVALQCSAWNDFMMLKSLCGQPISGRILNSPSRLTKSKALVRSMKAM